MSESTDSTSTDVRISALVDGEISPRERRKLLAEVAANATLRGRWERYHTIRSVLSGERASAVGLTFADRVGQQIAQERLDIPPPWRRVRPDGGSGWRATAAGTLLVGAIAVATALVLAPDFGAQQPPLETIAMDTSQAQLPVAEATSPMSPDMQQRLGLYLVTHSEYAATGELPGMMPYTRVAGFSGTATGR